MNRNWYIKKIKKGMYDNLANYAKGLIDSLDLNQMKHEQLQAVSFLITVIEANQYKEIDVTQELAQMTADSTLGE